MLHLVFHTVLTHSVDSLPYCISPGIIYHISSPDRSPVMFNDMLFYPLDHYLDKPSLAPIILNLVPDTL